MESFQKTVKKYLMSQLRTQMSSTVSKFEPSIVDGCFTGLYYCLKIFPLKKKVLEQLSTAHSIPILILKCKEKRDLFFYNLGGGIK